ncbi:hypothetical protein TI05_10180 [Achromatium sp. WMS3]|nr:hypothetical protein TI05_10180 [Achromatium sp. WMS3]
MNVVGVDVLKEELQRPNYFLKAVLNEFDTIFFPANIQHSSIRLVGLSYSDLEGNALAAVINNNKIEIRGHQSFSVEKVIVIVKILLNHPDLLSLRTFQVYYKGEHLHL